MKRPESKEKERKKERMDESKKERKEMKKIKWQHFCVERSKVREWLASKRLSLK
jgi:hypothetical protein